MATLPSYTPSSIYQGLARAELAMRWVLRVGAFWALLEAAYLPTAVGGFTADNAALVTVLACLCLAPNPVAIAVGIIGASYLIAAPAGTTPIDSAAPELTIYALLLLACTGLSAAIWNPRKSGRPPHNRTWTLWTIGVCVAVSIAGAVAPLVVEYYPTAEAQPVYTGATATVLVLGWLAALALFVVPLVISPLRQATLGPPGVPNCRTTDVALAALAGFMATPVLVGMPTTDHDLGWYAPTVVCAALAAGASLMVPSDGHLRTTLVPRLLLITTLIWLQLQLFWTTAVSGGDGWLGTLIALGAVGWFTATLVRDTASRLRAALASERAARSEAAHDAQEEADAARHHP